MNGIIIRIISNLYTVKCGDELYGCRARGVFRNKKISPMVGDIVTIDPDNNVIIDIRERKNELHLIHIFWIVKNNCFHNK